MNIPLYGDTFEIKDEFFSDDEETTDIKPSIRLPDGDAAIMAVASIMEGYGTDISEQLLTEFKKMQIETRDLSALTDKDLELFGFKDKNVRASMIQEFGTLPNQNEHFGNSEPPDTRKYNLMLRNAADHLEDLDRALSSVLYALRKKKHTEDILIDDSTYSSSVVLRTVEEMNKTVIRLKEKFEGKDEEKPRKKGYLWRKLIIFGAISAGSVLVIKYAGMKSNLWGH